MLLFLFKWLDYLFLPQLKGSGLWGAKQQSDGKLQVFHKISFAPYYFGIFIECFYYHGKQHINDTNSWIG